MDSDVYKWLEAAAWEMGRAPSEWLRSTSEAAVDLVAAAQGDDGYVNSYYTVAEPGKRWIDFAHGHELYCGGHLIQAAVAFRRATGDDRLLAVARRFADHLHSRFGPGRRVATPGHPEIEMALVELYRETGERRHLELAAFFLEHRGRGWLGPGRYGSASFQDRVPVRDATAVEGHAVRALYLTTGATDIYLETGEAALLAALNRQWHDLVSRKVYITGGVGGRHLSEAFGQPYELPNDLAYCETCGAIASIMWSWRMLLATGDSRFGDLIERTLYNAVLAGVSLTGDRYFYVNPLASNGEAEYLSRGGCIRQDWHTVACCPPNVMRQLATFGHYIATRDAAGLQIHQYAAARIAADLGSGPAMVLRMETTYPWEGRVRLSIEHAPTTSRTLSFRVPGWCTAATGRVNGRPLSPGSTSYLRVDRVWHDGDVVELDFAMDARLIEAHPRIESTHGCVAIERGPLVYCLEQADHPEATIADVEIDTAAPLESSWVSGRLEGVTVVRGSGWAVDTAPWKDRLYRPVGRGPAAPRRRTALTAIPYYAWANRGPGAMRVWIPRGAVGSGIAAP
ncbi:MAG: glycoside hydrolase family 127 protein, partial [Candidatus Rokuibacteriota bacterium]